MIRQSEDQTKLRKVIQNEIARAEGGDDSEVSRNRELALDAYYGGERTEQGTKDDDDMITTMSSMDVADMTTAVLAQLCPMLSTDALVTFEPKGQDDEEQVRAESAAVNHIIMEQNNGFIRLQEAIKDALLLRNACAKVYVDEQKEVRYIPLSLPPSGETDEPQQLNSLEIAALLQPRAPNETRTLAGDKVRVTTTTRRFCMKAVPIDNIVYEANADSSDIQSFRFFAERLSYTRSELVDMGYKKSIVYELPYQTEETNSVQRRRNRTEREGKQAETKDQEVIECYETYLLIDLNNDGISERYKVLYAGTYILDHEEVPIIPYSIGTAFITPHRLQGESIFDRLRDVQKVKTYFLRLWMTNAALAVNGRMAADPTKVNFDDLLSTQGGVVRVKQDGTIQEIKYQDAGGTMLSALEYQDKVRSERGGAALDLMSAELQIAGETAHGVERQYSQKELLVAFMAANLGETFIRPLYLIMHLYLRYYANEPLQFKLSGEWVTTNPQDWQQRDRCNVKAGKSAGERTHIQNVLSQVIQLQVSAMQQGMDGVLVDLQNIYNAVTDWATYAGLDTPDGYLVNPSSPQSKQAQKAKADQANAQAQQQQAMMQGQLQLVQEQLNLERMRLQQQAKKDGDELAYKYWSDRLQAETKETEIVAKGTIDLERVKIEGEQREAQALRVTKASPSRANGASQ